MSRELDEKEKIILKLEIVSLFFLIEKVYADWWKKGNHGGFFGGESNVLIQNINADIENLLKDLLNFEIGLSVKTTSSVESININIWKDFFNNWREWRKVNLDSNKEKVIQVIFGSCEGLNSGIEKGSPKEHIKGNEPFLAGAFGTLKFIPYEKFIEKIRRIIFSSNDIQLEIKNLLENYNIQMQDKDIPNFNLSHIFENLKTILSKTEVHSNEVDSWRDNAYKAFKLLYKLIPSDSRFPINDTSLFDQIYMSTSMFKAKLNELLSKNLEIELEDVKKHQNFRWRILGIQYDKFGLAEKGLKLASIQWYREIAEKIDEELKKLLEVEYPIGNEIYRDETGIYFIVGEDIDELPEEIQKEIKNIFENTKLNDGEIEGLKNEISFYITLSKPSRGLMNLSALLENAKINFLKRKKIESVNFEFDTITHNGKKYKVKKGNNYTRIIKKDPNTGETTQERVPNTAIGICPICQVRLVYIEDTKKNNKPAICEVCDKRIHHFKTSRWIKNTSGETIWLEEVKDKNNRVAYISLKFELEDWLNGNLLNSLLGNKGLNDYNLEKAKIKELILKGIVEEEKASIINKILVQKIEILEKLETNLERLKTSGEFNNLKNELKKISLNKEIGNIAPFFNNTVIKDIVTKLREIKDELYNIHDQFVLVSNLKNLKNEIKQKIGTDKIYDKIEVLKRKKDSIKDVNQILGIIGNISEDLKHNFSEIIAILNNLKSKDINIKEDFIEETIKENIYPFLINEELLNYYSKYTDESGKPSVYTYFQSIIFEAIKGNQWEEWLSSIDFLKEKIDFENEKINWDLIKENERVLDLISSLLLQFLLRKNPSPARLRRIWETTREFFEDIHENLDEILEIPDWRKKRLVWEVDLNKNNKLSESMELEAEGLLFWAEKINNKAKIYLISSIRDFLIKFGNNEIKKQVMESKDDLINEKIKNLKENIVKRKIVLKPYDSPNDKENNIKINTDAFSKIEEYKPFAKITDPSPRNYQIVIPAEYLEKFIDKVMEKYNKEFKYVYGKLPIHIGIVVSHYKKPAYVNLKALRRIRRDVKDMSKLYIQKDIREFCIYQKKKLSLASLEELVNNTESYYSFYWNNPNEKDYSFYIKPDNEWKKWISTIDKFPQDSNIEIIPNTFDFEFMDTNTRRNDIFYDEIKGEGYKRVIPRKSNRPYEIEEYWEKFKAFKELVIDLNYQRSRLFKIVEFIYPKLQEIEELEIDYSYMFAPVVYRYLDLNDRDRRKIFRKVFNIDENLDTKEYIEKLREYLAKKENIYLFLDMFEFWYTMLKEV